MKNKHNKNSMKAKSATSTGFDAKHPRDAQGRFIKKGA